MDIYFRQYWRDHRLAYENFLPDYVQHSNNHTSYKSMALEANFVDRIWKPDLFFLLVKKGEIAKITKPNKLIRLDSDGKIFYSQRFEKKHTIKNLYICPLKINFLRHVIFKANHFKLKKWAHETGQVEDQISQFKDVVNLRGREKGLLKTKIKKLLYSLN